MNFTMNYNTFQIVSFQTFANVLPLNSFKIKLVTFFTNGIFVNEIPHILKQFFSVHYDTNGSK